MHRSIWIACLLLASAAASAGEQKVDSRVESVGLFKNGLAVVSRIVQVPGPGVYRLEDVPEPVHGTFWLESDAKVTARVSRRSVEVPASVTPGLLQEDLAGCRVTVHFADGRTPPASGRVVTPPAEPAVRDASPPAVGFASMPQPASPARFLVLEDGGERVFVDASRIASIRVEGARASVKRRKAVMLLEVGKTARRPASIRISYLAKGMAWAPSYRVDISDPAKLVLTQKAIIRNELEPLEETAVRLISGFPNVEFGHVSSPLSPETSLQAFFAALSRAPRSWDHVSMGNVVTQQAVRFNRVAPEQGLDLSAIPTGDGVDLHEQDIGRQTLGLGDALAVQTASARAPYQRIVEWIVPDTRDAYGRSLPEHRRQQDPDQYEESAWDAIRFRNPLAFPMTTAPAMIVEGDRFNGQRLSTWVNRGEMCSLRITKALSVRTLHREEEVKQKRKEIYLGGDRYYRAAIDGNLKASNHRNETVSLVIQRSFSGKLLKVDGKPECILLPEGVDSVNRRNQCTWRLKLKPGQLIELGYQYSLLVRY
ncbi:MAG: hypothetical protein JXR96_00100 [Deltaproteobacteria bacterium]|nr:hypothetical protein [Deltaproteobacteria bacterium]